MTEATATQPEPRKPRSTRLNEEILKAEYPHMVSGTLHFLPEENKQAVTIRCTYVDPVSGDVCGKEREVRTSDLFQVNKCEICTLKARRAKAKARRAKAREAEANAG
jgi:hypothetical protein